MLGRFRQRSVASIARGALAEIAGGTLTRLPVSIRFWDGSTLPATGTSALASAPPVVQVVRPRAVAHLIHGRGQLGLARAFIDGSLTSDDDLESLLALRGQIEAIPLSSADLARLALAAVRAAGPGVLIPPPRPLIEARVSGDRHSVRRDRQAVRHHYDVSNDFYRLVLGPSMVYSCAYFADPEEPLEDAQERKLELICKKLALAPDERLLDIGCGWGSLVIHAAVHHGVRATGITLSEPQAALARRRAQEEGVGDRVEIIVADYRELTGRTFDKIASVGMYEHVGREALGTYARTAALLLAPGGLMLNHGIARLDSEPPSDRTFVNRYIFPDGDLRPLGELVGALQDSGLEVRDVESLREHYPLTLRRWVANLRENAAQAAAAASAERVRSWELYMLGSALAFEDADITVYQVLAARLGAASGLPLERLRWLSQGEAAAT